MWDLCSTYFKLNFFAKLYNKLLALSEIIIIFFESFLIIFSEKKLVNVSIVLPDLDITINRALFKSSLFFKFKIFFEFKSFKK